MRGGDCRRIVRFFLHSFVGKAHTIPAISGAAAFHPKLPLAERQLSTIPVIRSVGS